MEPKPLCDLNPESTPGAISLFLMQNTYSITGGVRSRSWRGFGCACSAKAVIEGENRRGLLWQRGARESSSYRLIMKICPICIALADRHGNPIAPIWFEQGVAPVQNELRDLAHYRLRDVHRVSELAEITVHKLWEMHGEDAGACPWRRVWVRAIWEARDMAAGESRWFLRRTVPLALDSLDQNLYGSALTDPTHYDDVVARKLLVELVERRIENDHREDFREAFKMLRQGYTWDEIANRLHEPQPITLKKRFWRWIRDNVP